MAEPPAERWLGLLATTAIGIGGMVGGGIFAVLGTAVALADLAGEFAVQRFAGHSLKEVRRSVRHRFASARPHPRP